MIDQEKLVELIKSAKEAMRGKEFTCNLEREYFTAEYLIAHGATVREMQKPLTVEEAIRALDIVWFERKHGYATLPCVTVIEADCVIVSMVKPGYNLRMLRTIKDYGKTWRCWAEKPTDEERKAVEWEK